MAACVFSFVILLNVRFMKRLGMLVSLLALLLSTPALVSATSVAAGTPCMACDALPWETVDAVLKRVDALYAEYTYTQLVDWYHVGLLTVEQSGSGYLVTIYDQDGAVIAILISDI